MTLEELAEEFGIEVAVVKAVAEVESAGKAGQCLMEPHLFSRYTQGKYDVSHPQLSSKKWNKKLYKTNKSNYETALKLDRKACMLSTSYGVYQILGSNFALCRCDSLEDFVKRIEAGEDNTLFFNFIKHRGLVQYLKNKEWDKFAALYNGPSYKQNKYAEKLAKAYAKFSKE